MYHEEESFPVYCRDCWYADKWDPRSYGVEYDFSKPFFFQWKELFNRVPRLALWQVDMTDSPYANIARQCKNAYLSYSLVGGGGENVFYSKGIDTSSNIFDCLNINDCESCYENVHDAGNSNSHFCVESRNCIDSWFLFDCRNCQECALSVNLRNKKYVLKNQQYDKEGYYRKLEELNLGSYESKEKAEGEFAHLVSRALHKYADIVKATESSGNYIANAKRAISCFNVYNVEDIKNCFRVFDLKDSHDVTYHIRSELVYEYLTGGMSSQRIRFTMAGLDAIRDTDYIDYCGASSNLFGCIGIRNGEYCILNKQYTKAEYEALVPKIKEHMNAMPYIDASGKVYKYGEFFPPELSSFGYNETTAQEHFPLRREEAREQGYRWRERNKTQYGSTMSPDKLPDHIKNVQDSVLRETIVCRHHEQGEHRAKCEASCTTAFKITPMELQFYRDKEIPLPRLCPNCRHFERLQKIAPYKLWHRKCQCAGAQSENPPPARAGMAQTGGVYKNVVSHSHGTGKCPNEFETSYDPERPEVVYCEQCYQAEVV